MQKRDKLIFGYYLDSTDGTLEIEKRRIKIAQVVPVLFLLSFWMVEISKEFLGINLSHFGVYPREPKGLIGILTAPFIHGDFKHLMANSISFYVLSVLLFYFYRNISYLIFILNFFFSGVLLWIIGRSAWHIGASGIIYGMASFLFFSGLFRGNVRLLTIALVTVFLYGSLFWGIFPSRPEVSWEAHLSGALSGLVLSIVFWHNGPQRPVSPLDEEDENEDEEPSDLPDAATLDENETSNNGADFNL